MRARHAHESGEGVHRLVKPADWKLTNASFRSLASLKKALPKKFAVNGLYEAEFWPWSCNLLQWAIGQSPVNLIEFLIDKGADVNAVLATHNQTPLYLTFAWNSWAGAGDVKRRCDVARVLIAAGADPNFNTTKEIGNRVKNTPFLRACSGTGPLVRKSIAEMLPLVDVEKQSPNMAVWHAIENEDVALLDWCIRAGVTDVNEKHHYNGKDWTLLKYAAWRAHDNVRITRALPRARSDEAQHSQCDEVGAPVSQHEHGRAPGSAAPLVGVAGGISAAGDRSLRPSR
jgi:hypothetical protein